MFAVQFFVYALIIFLLLMLFGGTMIGYYFAKKAQFEIEKAQKIAAILKGVGSEKAQ